MTNEITPHEAALVRGDLSRLSDQERHSYYTAVCESLELNPLTQPLAYITPPGGKMLLYVTRSGTDQLRAKRGVSIVIASRVVEDGILVVTARATLPDGRTDEAIGAVSIQNLKGESLANAYMKAETKAKRRVTLSAVGLGWMDESETSSVQGATYMPIDTPPPARPALPDAAPAAPADDRAKRQRQAYVARFTELVEQALALDIDPFDAYEDVGPHNYATVLTNNQMETIATEIKRMIAEAEAAQLHQDS